ncbi:DNA adenine methylase [soil metagenome]
MNGNNALKVAEGTSARPFLKWAGGKRWLVATILAQVGGFNRYYEPFLGGGALFFGVAPREAAISDANAKLVTTYKALQYDPDAVTRRLRSYVNTPEFYNGIRQKNFDVGPIDERAADFIYCNRVNFNGLYRENRRGQYNVPFGRNPRATICDEPNLLAVAEALQGVEVRTSDFEEGAANAAEGDLCYFDPPYVPLSATSNFTSYQADGFGSSDQVRLRDLAMRLRERGVRVVLSNSSAPFVFDLYKDFNVVRVSARRAINSNAEGRGAIDEVLIT